VILLDLGDFCLDNSNCYPKLFTNIKIIKQGKEISSYLLIPIAPNFQRVLKDALKIGVNHPIFSKGVRKKT
jgi:hypothetical protein